MSHNTMEELVAKLNEASSEYYNGHSIMSDFDFDAAMKELESLEKSEGRFLPNSPLHNVGATAVDSLPKFTHTYPALSLDKTKDVNELISKFQKGVADSGCSNDKVVVMYKEDGSTIQAYYNRGKLDKLVTRGNGEVGNIITHNARNIAGLPITIPFEGELVVRGEALMSYDAFNTINEKIADDEKFKNPRNLAAATVTMLNSAEAAERPINLKAFNLVHVDSNDNKFDSFSERLNFLDELGFSTVDRIVCAVSDTNSAINHLSSKVDSYPYPVDGLVVAMDNYKYSSTLSGTEHHPNIMQGYAFKWADETVETVLRDIEWSPSRTGLFNPVAVFDPIEIEGTTVTRASLHNVSYVLDKQLVIGDSITVYKANKIIPQIDKNLSKDDNASGRTDEIRAQMPKICPRCGAELVIKSCNGVETLMCPNEECPEKMIGKLAHFCERDCMDIQGMSEETIQKLVDAGFIKEYADFFKLEDKLGIAFLPGFGKQSFNKMCQASLASKSTDFVHFITALSIPNLGKGQAKALRKYLLDNYDYLVDVCHYSEEFNLVRLLSELGRFHFNFMKVDGFGEISAMELQRWLFTHLNKDVDSPEMRVLELITLTDKLSQPVTSTSLSGKSFCITGKLIHFSNRQELVDKIEAAGGKWVDSVSSKTDYLINNDVTSTSGKNKKAMELNIPIISEEDFLKMV